MEKNTHEEIVIVTMLGCAIAAATWVNAGQGRHTKQWRQKMQQLSQVLTDLIPYVISEQQFNDPANAARIAKDAHQMAALAHTIRPSSAAYSPDADPSIPIMAQLFDQQAAKAVKQLDSGHRAYKLMVFIVWTGKQAFGSWGCD